MKKYKRHQSYYDTEKEQTVFVVHAKTDELILVSPEPDFKNVDIMYHVNSGDLKELYKKRSVSIKSKINNVQRPENKTRAKISPISDKEKQRLALYRKKRSVFMDENPVCQYPGCNAKSTDLHHAAGRVGSNLTNEATFRALCHNHHMHIEINPALAKEMNLSINRI